MSQQRRRRKGVAATLCNMNIGNAYRRARNALCFEKPNFASTVQLDNIKAKHRPKNQTKDCKQNVYFRFGLTARKMYVCCTIELARAGLPMRQGARYKNCINYSSRHSTLITSHQRRCNVGLT